jgi:hypothetical protein
MTAEQQQQAEALQRLRPKVPVAGAFGNWLCVDCGNVNWATREKCHRCPARHPGTRPPSSILAVSLDTDGLYSRLGVSPYATQKEIQRAFHKQSLQLHPDKHGGSDPEMTNKFQEMKAAYEVLFAPGSRQAYDGRQRKRRRV